MKKDLIDQDEIKLIGLFVRTNNQNEMDPRHANIAPLVGYYFGQQIASEIANRRHPGVTIAAYTDYASDEKGDYTYFIGEEVTSFAYIPKDMAKLIIPAGNYQKFTTPPGKMPEVVINAWQQIWQMKPEDFGGKRAYIADFEVYDERASDSQHAVIDIYIGIK